MCRVDGGGYSPIEYPGDEAMEEALVENLGRQFTAEEFVQAVAGTDEPRGGEVIYEYGWNPAEQETLARVRAKRNREYDEFAEGFRQRKRQREIDAELDWLASNKLFRGQPPGPGEDWSEYQANIRKRRRELDDERQAKRQRVTGGMSVPLPQDVVTEVPVEPYPVAHYPPGYVPTPEPGVPSVDLTSVSVGTESGVVAGRPTHEDYGLPVDPDFYSNPFDPESVQDMLSKTRESPFVSNKKPKKTTPLRFLKRLL